MSGAKNGSVLIAGASVRAAVQSAQRSGTTNLIAADMFQDRDLGSAVRWRLSHDYGRLKQAVRQLRPAAWMYTGALENWPDRIAAIDVRLLGCPADVLRNVRDPWIWSAALSQTRIAVSPLARTVKGLPRDGTWIRKRRASAAGRHLAIVDARLRPTTESAESLTYYQRRVIGRPMSAVFVAAEGRCRFLGATQQIIGCGDPTAGDFQYLGSIGPVTLPQDRIDQWMRIGEALVCQFRLVGLFGVDAVDDGLTYVPVEINPRYTASVEILERAMGIHAWTLHVSACRQGDLDFTLPRARPKMMGKRIVFSRGDTHVNSPFLDWVGRRNTADTDPSLADIPASPRIFPRGSPLLTVLTRPKDLRDVHDIESELEAEVERVHHAVRSTSFVTES